VQVSGASHAPTDARHVKLDGWKPSTHVFETPLQ
jgi:hypothetical protein